MGERSKDAYRLNFDRKRLSGVAKLRYIMVYGKSQTKK
jgi:hypothetical protein